MTKKNTTNAKNPSKAKGGKSIATDTGAKYGTLRLEEDIKNNVHADWFGAFDYKPVEKLDFCVFAKADADTPLEDRTSFLWAESKLGTRHDIHESLVQMILTIGKARAYTRYQPPKFIGAFDAQKMAFIPYHEVADVFRMNDFNWNVTPSNHKTREFRLLFDRVKDIFASGTLIFDFLKDAKELAQFIKSNFAIGKGDGLNLTQIDKNNFTHIYGKWREAVLPTIEMPDWAVAKRSGIIDADFFLADIFSADNETVMNRLNVLLRNDHYQQSGGKSALGLDLFTEIRFNDRQKAHRQFWSRYKRPPLEEYWDDIMNRRDLLVPQDIRERKGSFFTPRRWVELSQEYLARELGENWQDEYYIWDCCAGTGNMEAGLLNKYCVWASTIDQADVDVMHERIKYMDENSTDGNGANLLDSHVFQFDFLNDSFDKLPPDLRSIIDDPKKRSKLIIYINPPYAEAATKTTVTGTGKAKTGVATENMVARKYGDRMDAARNELFAQFFMRITVEIPGCIIGEFSKLKHVQAPNFATFRNEFRGKLSQCFIVPANTFDNVKGDFPIGFFVWRLNDADVFTEGTADVYDSDGQSIGIKTLTCYTGSEFINKWYARYYDRDRNANVLAIMNTRGNDFQNFNYIRISSTDNHNHTNPITVRNLVPSCIYLAVRHCIEATWLNDRDQFLCPSGQWHEDEMFQSDCMVYTFFSPFMVIKSADGTNHWIPFTAAEVGANDNFKSTFMSDFLAGKVEPPSEDDDLFSAAKRKKTAKPKPVKLSREAKAVMAAGRELWRYYHKQPKANPNASFYDIRLHFQGVRVTASGKEMMNSDSPDATYTKLLAKLRAAHKALAKAIEPKVYEYGFLKR